jgi:hypothetical protein
MSCRALIDSRQGRLEHVEHEKSTKQHIELGRATLMSRNEPGRFFGHRRSVSHTVPARAAVPKKMFVRNR